MFDIGFSELIAIGIVALVVIGPERLPKVARTAGHLLGRLQRYVNDVKADINREMQLDELRKLQADMQESARGLEHSLNSEVESIKNAVDAPEAPVAETVATLAEPVAQPAVTASESPVLTDDASKGLNKA